MENLIFIPTQRYDLRSGWIGNWYVGIILLGLDGIWICHWNMERVIFFQTGFLQCIHLVYVSINICDRLFLHLDLWNKGSYDELVQDSYRAVE